MSSKTLAAVVLPPDDVISILCGTKNVNIPVAVKVCGIDIVGPIKIIINSVLSEIFLTIVLAPGETI